MSHDFMSKHEIYLSIIFLQRKLYLQQKINSQQKQELFLDKP